MNLSLPKGYIRLLIVPLAFVSSILGLWILVKNRPILDSPEVNRDLHFPTSLDDIKQLLRVIALYKENHWEYVLLIFSASYIFKQTFAIPGSALLNILGGAIFGCWPMGLPLCCLLTAIGATNCFMLSKLTGRNFVRKRFATNITWLENKMIENEGQVFLFLVSLRLFPASPNWLINIMAPYVDVSPLLFFLSVLIGLLPYNWLCFKAGETLSELESLNDVLTPKRLLLLLSMALVTFTLSHFARKSRIKLKR